MSDREVHRFRGGQVQRGIVLLVRVLADQAQHVVVDLGVALELVLHFRVVGQADTSAVGGLNQDTDVVAQSSVVTLDLDFTVRCQRVQGYVRFELAVDTVNGRTEADRHLVVEGIADSWLQGDDLDFALAAEVTAGKAVFIVCYQTERCVYAETDRPLVIEWLDVIAHRHAHERDHVTFVGAAVRTRAGIADVGVCVDECNTAGYLFAFEARHAGRVANNGGCVVGRRRSPGKTSTHPADALFVQGKATCKDLGGCHGNGEANGGFEHYFFHY
ncbi:hypothetical protein D3C86_1489850 [compost metagenome]